MAFIEENKDDPELADIVGPVGKALGKLQTATLVVAQRGLGDPEEAGAAASDYLRMFGLVAVGYMWCQMAKLARDKRNGDAFYATKLKTARFYVQKILPDSCRALPQDHGGQGHRHGPRRRRVLGQCPPFRHARTCPDLFRVSGHPRSLSLLGKNHVDGRDKPGHDAGNLVPRQP